MRNKPALALGAAIIAVVVVTAVVWTTLGDRPAPSRPATEPVVHAKRPPPPPAASPFPDPEEPGIIGKAGFFHLEDQGGTWWLVDPAGARFVSIGMNHLEPALVV